MYSLRRYLSCPLLIVLILLVSTLSVRGVFATEESASEGAPPEQAQIEFHNRDTLVPLPLRSMISRTQITGPVATTDIEFVAENANTEPIEATMTLEVPQGTVLTRFGYFYGDRFIPGKMYDKGEAWKIYTAVTSRGRDPGIMDRPTETNYHAQIFPVAPRRDLRVRITLVQMLQTTPQGMRFELPLIQGSPYLSGWNPKPFLVDASVRVVGYGTGAIQTIGETDDGKALSNRTLSNSDRTVAFHRTYTPRKSLSLLIPFARRDTHALVYSAMVGKHEGYYAVTIVTPRNLNSVRAHIQSHGRTGQSQPTRFAGLAPYDNIHIVGRYTTPGPIRISLLGEGGSRIRLPIHLSGSHVRRAVDNPAASLWANKRIAQLQDATRRNFQPDIIRLSQRFMIVSNFTALLAIPQEELDYYRKVLAKQNVRTNTDSTGGGGGDPYIAVRAPEDAARVVALFPDGDIRNLSWNPEKQVWDGRFDIPFGTPEGEYRVTIIVVQKSGRRNQFTLVYQNRLTGPTVNTESLQTLTAPRGGSVHIALQGAGIRRATALTPWGERVALEDAGQGIWSGELNIPATQATGNTTLTVILLDGAHNSTEVTLDLEIH